MKLLRIDCAACKLCVSRYLLKAPWLALLVLSPVTAAQSPALFASSFESAEGFAAGGPPHGWFWSPGVRISSTAAVAGEQCVTIPASDATELIARDVTLPDTTRELFIDFSVRPSTGADVEASTYVELGVSAIGFRRTADSLQVLAFDGTSDETGRWVVINTAKRLDGWFRVTIRHDYTRNQWDLYLNGGAALTGLGFFSRGLDIPPAMPFGIFGASAGDTVIDAVYIGPSRPFDIGANGPSTGSDSEYPHSGSRDLKGRDGLVRHSRHASPGGQTSPPVDSTVSLLQRREQKLKVALVIYSVLE